MGERGVRLAAPLCLWLGAVTFPLWLWLVGGQFAASAQARGTSLATMTASGSTVSFAGYSWAVKSSQGLVGPGPNVFSDSLGNVWVDAVGQLHLRITYRDGQWQCAEVALGQSLGYGKYSFTVASSVGALDPNVVLGLFTWSDDPAYNHREMDVEFARWGDAAAPTNAQYVVQPYDHVGNLTRFVQPLDAPTVHSFTWAPKSVTFASATATNQAIASWRYRGADVPRAGGERTHINLWLNKGTPPANGSEVEVVFSNFSFARY